MALSLAPGFFHQLSQICWKCVLSRKLTHTWKRISKPEAWRLSQHAPEDPLMQPLILRSVWRDLSPSDLRFEQCALCHLAKGRPSTWLLCPPLRCRKAEPDCLNILFRGIMFYCLVYFTVIRTFLFFLFLLPMGPSGERVSHKEEQRLLAQ